MDSILKLMPALLELSGYQEEVCEKAVYATFNLLVGDSVRRNCTPIRLFKKRLYIAARDATWRHQLERMSGQILFRLNSTLGGAYVTHLEFRVSPKLVLEAQGHQAPPPVEFHDLPAHEAEVAPAAAKIKDDELRQAFLRAAGKCLERREG